MILKLILLGFFTLSLVNCRSQTATSLDESKYVLDRAVVKNEFDLVCKEFRSKQDPKLILRLCYWDTAMTKLASKHIVKDGKYDGPCVYWNANGNLTIEGEYKLNLKNGKWNIYVLNKLSEKGNYENGKKKGIWLEFDTSGKVVREKKY